jgi:hypothetical protein
MMKPSTDRSCRVHKEKPVRKRRRFPFPRQSVRSKAAAFARGLARKVERIFAAFGLSRSRTMTLQPFPVHHRDPEFVIIEFFGNDNSLTWELDPDLDAIALAAGADLAVLAVTDWADRTAQVVEITTNTKTILEDLGEIDTGDVALLTTLLARALLSYPRARHIAIGFSGHGSGVFSDIDPKPYWRLFPGLRPRLPPIPRALANRDSLLHAYAVLPDWTGGLLTNSELREMLRDGFADAGRGANQPVDLIFFDTCLNGMIEVVTEFEDFADCIVGSTDLLPGAGWDYREWLSRMNAAPPADGVAWGRQAVEAIEAVYDGQVEEYPVTLSAVRPRSSVTQRFADLVGAADRLGLNGFTCLDQARSQTQLFGDRYVDSYDLLDFARHLAKCKIGAIAGAANALILAIEGAVAASIALGDEVARGHGLAFWFPGTRRSFLRDVDSYSRLQFDAVARWSRHLERYR